MGHIRAGSAPIMMIALSLAGLSLSMGTDRGEVGVVEVVASPSESEYAILIAEKDGEGLSLSVRNKSNPQHHVLATDPDAMTEIAWHPDGRSIAYLADLFDSPTLVVVSVETGQTLQRLRLPEGQYAGGLAWATSDELWIASETKVCLVASRRGKISKCVDLSRRALRPSLERISSMGKYLAFAARKGDDVSDGEEQSIFVGQVVNNGIDLRRLTSGFYDSQPSLSRSGRVVFARQSASTDSTAALWIVDEQGRQTALTDGQRLDRSPSWNSDESGVLFTRIDPMTAPDECEDSIFMRRQNGFLDDILSALSEHVSCVSLYQKLEYVEVPSAD